ncbi:MAG: antibiotic biosynthesis monooxygenase [Candidatus Rokubacteria bacterium]|nr:antibiotic biosynthesis monooxygenase [Candidatus Rokubacteria bacterium]
MIVLLFKSQLRADIDVQDYQATRARMMDLVNKIPGFVSYKTFRADDGETLAIARFESEEALETWRHHPGHVATQRRGHEEFYESYWIQVCRTVRNYGWSRAEGRVSTASP